jgi:putative ABC transport system permease protein
MVLLFLQLGFYDACFRSATLIYAQLDFDIALVSPQYEALRASGTIPRRRLYQAKAVPGVARVVSLYLGNTWWRNPETKFQREVLMIGVDPDAPTFQVPELVGNVAKLKKEDTGIWDLKGQKGYGVDRAGSVGELESRKLQIVATYAHGSGFVSSAVVVVSDRTFCRVLSGYPRSDVSIGLVKIRPGADPDAVVRALTTALPADIQLMRRSELEAIDQHYFVRLKPVGIMFSSGVALAVAVGGVILYQLLASEIVNYIREYATLRAIGYSPAFLNALVLQQAALLGLFGFVPASLLAVVIYEVTRQSTNLPMIMTWSRMAQVVVLAASMCSVSGLLLIRKVNRADPAELF